MCAPQKILPVKCAIKEPQVTDCPRQNPRLSSAYNVNLLKNLRLVKFPPSNSHENTKNEHNTPCISNIKETKDRFTQHSTRELN